MFLTRTKTFKKVAGQTAPRPSMIAIAKLRLEGVVLRFFWWGSLLLGPELASHTGARLMRWLSGPKSNAMRRIRRNLKVALPNENEATIERLAKDALANLGRVVAEYPHLRRIAGPELGRFIEFVADVPAAAFAAGEKPKLFVGMHQANWEVLCALSASLGEPMTIVVSPLSNPYVHRLVSAARPGVWVEQAERDNAIRTLVRSLKRGRSVGLLADQRFEGGQLVPFFGHDAMTAIGPAKLAIKFGCDLVPVRVERIGPIRFRITTFEPIRPADDIAGDQDKAIDMMRRVNQLFEAWIREKPGEWMCMKRRWPKAVYQVGSRASSPTALSIPAHEAAT